MRDLLLLVLFIMCFPLCIGIAGIAEYEDGLLYKIIGGALAIAAVSYCVWYMFYELDGPGDHSLGPSLISGEI